MALIKVPGKITLERRRNVRLERTFAINGTAMNVVSFISRLLRPRLHENSIVSCPSAENAGL